MTHLELARLVDYWTGEDPEVEDHAFECASCAARLAAIGALGRGVRDLATRTGGLTMATTPALVDRLAAAGLTLRHYRAAPGDVVPCSIGATDDLIVAWLSADVATAERIDVTVSRGDRVVHRFDDVPIDRANGRVVLTLAGDLARTFPTTTYVDRVIAVTAGGERVIAEYTFEHTAR